MSRRLLAVVLLGAALALLLPSQAEACYRCSFGFVCSIDECFFLEYCESPPDPCPICSEYCGVLAGTGQCLTWGDGCQFA